MLCHVVSCCVAVCLCVYMCVCACDIVWCVEYLLTSIYLHIDKKLSLFRLPEVVAQEPVNH